MHWLVNQMYLQLSLHIYEKSSRCGYSLYIVNTNLAMYIRSKKMYKAVGYVGLITLPHSSTLKKMTKEMKVELGLDPNIYVSIIEKLKRTNKPVCDHLLMNEIKLKNRISWNCMTNEVTEFVHNKFNTTTMLENIVGFNMINQKQKNS